MRRWFVWLPLSLLALLLAAVGAGLLARAELAEAAAKALLARRGLPNAELTVATLTHRRLEVIDLRLAEGAPAPRAARIAVFYSPGGLLDGQVERVEVDGIRVTVDTAAERPFGALSALLPAGGADRGTGGDTPIALPRDLPTVALRNAAVAVIDPRGTVEVNFDGRLGPGRNGDVQALLRGQARALHTTAELVVSAERLRGDPRLRVEVAGESDLGRLPWPAAVTPRPARGRASFALEADANLPAPGTALTPAALLERASTLALSLRVEEAALAQGTETVAEGVGAELDLRAEAGDGALLLRLAEPARLSAERLATEALGRIGLPPHAVALAASAGSLTVSPWTGGGEVVELRRTDDGWGWDGRASAQLALTDGGNAHLRTTALGTLAPDFTLRNAQVERLDLEAADIAYGPHRVAVARFLGRAEAKPGALTVDGTLEADGVDVAAGGRRLRGVSANAPLALRHTDAGTRLALSAPGRVRVPTLPATPPIQVDAPLELRLPALEVTAAGGELRATGRVDPGRITGRVARAGEADAPFTFVPGPIDLLAAPGGTPAFTAKMKGAVVSAPAIPARAEDIGLDIMLGGKGPLARIDVGRLAHLGAPAFAAPVRIVADLTRDKAGLLRADGRVSTLGTDFGLDLIAAHSPATGSGSISLNPHTVAFVPGGLQPGDLSPLLARQIERAKGRVELTGRIGWSRDGLDSSGRATVEGLDATTPHASVEGLNGTIEFDQLIRPETAGVQTLRATRAIAGVPLEDVTLRFTLAWPIAGPEIGIALAEGHLADGRVYVADERFAPLAERNRVTVRVEELSLSRLVAELEIEGVEADGVLAGQLPVLLTPEGLAIDRSRIDAVRTGSIRVDLGQTSDTLASRGEQVELMVRALKNFQYKELSMTLDRPAGGDPTLGITLEGRNPEVLDGYPFRFNITVTGDLDPILAALREGRRLTTDLLDRALQAR